MASTHESSDRAAGLTGVETLDLREYVSLLISRRSLERFWSACRKGSHESRAIVRDVHTGKLYGPKRTPDDRRLESAGLC